MVAVDRKFEFEIVSPEKLVLSEPVDMAVIPGSEGDIGVLAGHSLLITTLRPGVIDIYQGERITERLFVAGGFAEIGDTRCTVLADEATPVRDLDATVLTAQIERLRLELDAAENESERQSVTHRMTVAEAKLAATGKLAA